MHYSINDYLFNPLVLRKIYTDNFTFVIKFPHDNVAVSYKLLALAFTRKCE